MQKLKSNIRNPFFFFFFFFHKYFNVIVLEVLYFHFSEVFAKTKYLLGFMMLLSFNKFSISARTAPIYQSTE